MFKKDRRQKLAEKKQQNTIPKSPIIVRTQDKQYSQIKHVYPKCNRSTRFSKRTRKHQIDRKVMISDVLPERSENVNMHMYVLSTYI